MYVAAAPLRHVPAGYHASVATGDPDLNLLVALDALLAERSVTRAAARLNLSPSATSDALARLRAYFDDELLVQVGRRMEPTPRAEGLGAAVRDMLADLIDNQNQRLSRTPAAKEFERAVYNLAHADCRITTALGMRPRIGRWIGHWIKSVKHRACPR